MVVKEYTANGHTVTAVLDGNKVTINFDDTEFTTYPVEDKESLKFFWGLAITMANESK